MIGIEVERSIDAVGAWVESSFRFASSQIAAGHLGTMTVIAKLSELLFVEAVSQFGESPGGWRKASR